MYEKLQPAQLALEDAHRGVNLLQMVHGVASGTINDRRLGIVLPIVNQNSPDVDEDEQRNVRELLQREEEWK